MQLTLYKCGIISNIGNICNVRYTLLGVRMLIKDKKGWIKYHVTFHLPRLLVPYFEMKFPETKVCALFYSRMRFDLPIKRLRSERILYYDMHILFIGRRQRHKYLALNAYDRHKILVNEYLLNYPGATKLLKRDTSKDKTDLDVVKQNHRFLWDDTDESILSWEQRLAKKYYEKV